MGGHIIQKWYECLIDDQDHDRYDWVFRSVVENEDLYGWDYRLINENHDRYYLNRVCILERQSLWSKGRSVMSSEDLKDCSLHSWRYCVLGEGDLAAEPLYQSSESWRWSREKYFKRLVPTPFFWIAAPPRHSVLGIPIPKSLAFWASPSHITAAFWASPGTLPGCPNP